MARFFLDLKGARDKVVHAGSGVGFIFDTERGFCVNPKIPPFASFKGWRAEHYYNENIASILPWVGNIVLQTIDACNRMMDVFASVIQLPPEIAPGYHIYVRGPHTDAVAETVRVSRGQLPDFSQPLLAYPARPKAGAARRTPARRRHRFHQPLSHGAHQPLRRLHPQPRQETAAAGLRIHPKIDRIPTLMPNGPFCTESLPYPLIDRNPLITKPSRFRS